VTPVATGAGRAVGIETAIRLLPPAFRPARVSVLVVPPNLVPNVFL
jgi:hypothetical protein